jgi:pSer/pThr/pTyr-binding forkhead associated (FHA) protein
VQIEVGPATVETIRKPRIVIGSAAPADLLLRSDDVSAQHCELEVDPAGNVTVVDLASELGTFVAGELVSARRPLAVDAELGVGEYVVRLAHAPVEVAEFPWQTTLTIMERGGQPSTVTLRQREINIGRVANDIVLPKGNVSKRHCRISIRDDGTAYVVDLKSSNGTWMNGRNLVRNVQQFRVGDRLHVGDWVISLAHPPEKR